MSGIKLFVGLGNPGEKYEKTRHNAGFWWIDALASQTHSKLASDAKFLGDSGRLQVQSDAWLLKPSTFMNRSGSAVAALANYYKILPAEILIIHDELDLPVGHCKLKAGGGHAGHNGLKDIEAALGTKNFLRLRLGIGCPSDRSEVINFVLKAPSKDEQAKIDEKIYDSTQLVDLLLLGNVEHAMLKLHTKNQA